MSPKDRAPQSGSNPFKYFTLPDDLTLSDGDSTKDGDPFAGGENPKDLENRFQD